MVDDLAAVFTAIEELPADVDQLPDDGLADRMRQLVRARAMLDAVLAEHVAVFDARGAAGYDGQTSTRGWLRSRLRLGGQAGQLLTAARQLDGLPLVAKAFAAGEITLEQVGVVADLARQVGAEELAGFEPILVDLARQAPPGQVHAACAHVRQLVDAAGAGHDAARQRRVRQLSAARTLDGMVHVQGLLDPACGEVVLSALTAAMPVPAAYEERTPAQRRADALVDICDQWLACGHAPANGGLRPQVQVTISLDRLRDRPAGVAAAGTVSPSLMVGDVPVLVDHTPIPVTDARRIACDAGLIPTVLSSLSEPLDVGRQARLVPTGLRRALQLRDGGCRFPGCDRPPAWCDAHHITPWADGGPTDLANLLLVCRYHHTLIHEGWQLHGTPAATIHFTRPDHTRLDLPSRPRGRLITTGGP